MSLLRTVFGPSQEEIWSQVARDLGGEYIDGSFFGKDTLAYQHGEWEILLDTYTTSSGSGSSSTSKTYTRMRAPFVNKDELYFKLYREGFFAGIGKYFGMQDLEIGDPYFDNQFVIKGNNADKLGQLFRDERIKDLCHAQPDIHFEIRDDDGWFGARFGIGVDQLYFSCLGVVKETQVLKDLFELFARVLNRLVHIDSAYHDDPGVVLG